MNPFAADFAEREAEFREWMQSETGLRWQRACDEHNAAKVEHLTAKAISAREAHFLRANARSMPSTLDDIALEGWTFGADEHVESRARVWQRAARWALQVARNQDHRRVLVLASNGKGTGKSHLSRGVAYELALRPAPRRMLGRVATPNGWRELHEYEEPGHDCVVVSAPDLMNRYAATWNDPKHPDRDIIERCATCDVLVIDDLGAHKGSDIMLGDVLMPIFDRRYVSKLPTVLTTNHDPSTDDQWESLIAGMTRNVGRYFGHVERIVDRIMESVEVLRMEWPSWRRPEMRGQR